MVSTVKVDVVAPRVATGTTTLGVSGDKLLVPSGVTLTNSGTLSGFPGFDDVAKFTATGTYTVPSGIGKLVVFITGGGGGGAGGDNTTGKPGSGGLGATTVIARVSVVPADTITVAIGAAGAAGAEGGVGGDGGNSTFTHTSGSGSGSMSTLTAPGGKGGKFWASPATPAAGTV